MAVSKVCRWLGVPRSSAYYLPRQRAASTIKQARRPDALPEGFVLALIYSVVQAMPFMGIGQVWSYLRFTCGLKVNRKRIERLMRREGWTLRKRPKGGRPRVQIPRSVAQRPDERWATDIALCHCGDDGWCAFVPVIDCCTRQILGWELDSTARAATARGPWSMPCSTALAIPEAQRRV